MKNKKILSLGTMYLDITCIDFPFDTGLFAHRETVGNDYEIDLGGSALNFAKIAAQLEMNVSLLGKSGRDETGKTLINLLKKNNITPHVVFDESVQTNLAMHYVHKDGSSIMTSCGNANQSLSIKDINQTFTSLRDTIDYLYLGGVFKLKHLLPDLSQLVKDAQSHGITVVLDHGRVNNSVTSADTRNVQELLRYVDIYLPSIDEFLSVWDSATPQEAYTKLSNIAQPVTIIKQAEKGAIGFYNGEINQVNSYEVEVKNTVGAGDSFNAGFLSAHSKGMNVAESMQYACAVAATKISTKGQLSLTNISALASKEEKNFGNK